MLAQSRGGLCLSSEYTSKSAPLLWQCHKMHTWEAKQHSTQAGYWCKECPPEDRWDDSDTPKSKVRAELATQGLCPHRRPWPCEECNASSRKSIQKKKEAGLCVRGCGLPPISGKTRCQLHLDELKRSRIKREAKRVAARVCRLHPNRPVDPPSTIKCKECKIHNRIILGIRRSFKDNRLNKNEFTNDYLGCDFVAFIFWLGMQFQERMTWENYGWGRPGTWHMDHIRPKASFDLSQEDEIKRCWNYTNIRPLWWELGVAKGDLWDGTPENATYRDKYK